MFMREDLISLKSSKQTSVALFSIEAEYMSQTSAAINVMWARGILKEMNIEDIVLSNKKVENPIIIYADNQGAIKLINNPIFQKRIKHIAVKYHYTRDLISKGAIKLKYRPTSEMIADELTKPLGPIQFRRFVEQLDMTKESVK
jgi:hypothetical protein